MQFDIFEVKLRYCFNQLFSSRQEKDIGGGGNQLVHFEVRTQDNLNLQ